jgi:SH3-like domain-containing protein
MSAALIARAAPPPPQLLQSSVPRLHTLHAALTTGDANGYAGAPTNPDPPGWLLSRETDKDKDGRVSVEDVGMKRLRRPIHAFALDRRGLLALMFMLVLAPRAAIADPVGPVTKLPLPRFASLKTDRVNLREGPSKDHATKWVYERAGLPVEITAEFEIWRKVRDSEGVEGWVLHSLLSGRRTALVTPNKKGESSKLYARASTSADLAATLQSGVIVNVHSCDGAWCRVDGDGFKGYIEQEKLWGVYPNERLE